MATSPLGGFADLSAYGPDAIARRARRPGVLDAIIGGLQQGVELQQMPQNIRNQQLAAQLALELQQAKLQDLQNPELALQRKLQEEAIGAILSGRNPSLVFEPQVSPELAAMRNVAETQAGVPSPASDFQQIVPALRGMGAIGISPSAGLAAEQRALDAKIAAANARVRSSGVQGQFIPDGLGGMIFAQKPTAPGGEVITTQVKTPGGDQDIKVAPKGIKNILATNERTGAVTNIALAPGQEIPEGFSILEKKSGEEYKNIDAFRKEISNNEVFKQFGDINQAKERIDEAMAEAATTNNFLVVDQALISSFNRLLEPDSVTMVSEYLRTSQDAPLINKLTAGLTRPISGGRLAPEDRAALARLSERIYQRSLSNYSNTRSFYKGIGDRRTWEEADYLPPLPGFTRPLNNTSGTGGPSLKKDSLGLYK